MNGLSTKIKVAALVATGIGITLLTPHRAAAQDIAIWDGTAFEYRISDVPDLDQRRGWSADGTVWGLPNNGAMYCVPTAALNWMGYIANHGYPALPPGANDYQQGPPTYTAFYNAVTFSDLLMGILMGTDAFKGTNDAMPGLQNYLDSWYPGMFVVSEDYAHETHSPTYTDMALVAISGAMVDAGVGWYDSVHYPGKYIRKGGHHTSLVGADSALIYPGDIIIHDPADDTDLTTQSLFVDATYNVSDVTAMYGYLNGSNQTVSYTRTQTQIQGYGTGILDNYVAIRPLFGLTAQGPDIDFYFPLDIFMATSRPSHVRYNIGTVGNVSDIALDPIRPRHPFLLKGANDVWMIDQITGQASDFAPVTNPRHVAVGGAGHNIYCVTDNTLIGLLDNAMPFGRQPLSEPIDAVLCDGSVRKIVGFSSRASSFFTFDENLLLPAVQLPLKARVPGSVDLPLRMALDMSSHTYLLHRDGSPYLLRATLGRSSAKSTRLMLQGVKAAVGLTVDRMGNIYTTVKNADGVPTIAAFDRTGAPITTPFSGFPAGSMLSMLLPYSNFDGRTMTGPSFVNVLPPSITGGLR